MDFCTILIRKLLMLGQANRLALTCTSLCASSSAVALGNTEPTLKLPYISLVCLQQLINSWVIKLWTTDNKALVSMCRLCVLSKLLLQVNKYSTPYSAGITHWGLCLGSPGIWFTILVAYNTAAPLCATSGKRRTWPEHQLFPFLSQSACVIKPSIL